jgi:anaerobic ribonucleoside-triphosphate reductase activating protein
MNYIKITKNDIANGPGVRCALWVAGCNCHCKGCHNPSTWSFSEGRPFNMDSLNELFDAIDRSYIQGLTLTGGNPLDNAPEILAISRRFKERFPTKDLWLYSGYTYEEIIQSEVFRCILEYVDVIVDGPYIEEQRDITLKFRGSRNQRLIDVKETLKQDKIITLQND